MTTVIPVPYLILDGNQMHKGKHDLEQRHHEHPVIEQQQQIGHKLVVDKKTR